MNENYSDAIPLIQAAVLSQVFGLLSGVRINAEDVYITDSCTQVPKHFLMVDSFHGTIISVIIQTSCVRPSPQLAKKSTVGSKM